MNIDIYSTKQCPICKSDLNQNNMYDQNDWYTLCDKNGCFYYSFAYGLTTIAIFNEELRASYTFSEEEWTLYEEKVKNEIAYWLKNERYLTKLLGV